MLTLRPAPADLNELVDQRLQPAADVNQVVDQRLQPAAADVKNQVVYEDLKQALYSCLRLDMIDSECMYKLFGWLPLISKIILYEQWWKLQQCITTPALDSSLKIEDALKSEVAAGCILFLFLEVPHRFKERAARLLNFISFSTSDAPNLSNKDIVEAFVLDVLSRGGEEVQRQVCLSIYLLANVSRFEFSHGFHDELLLRIRSPNRSPKVTTPLMNAIASIARGSLFMTMKILDTDLCESWLGKLMSEEDDSSFREPACVAVACIVSYSRRSKEAADNKLLWDHLKSQLVPVIVNKCCMTGWYGLTIAAALALANITTFAASSPEQIDELVNGGCLRALFAMNENMDSEEVLSLSLGAIKTILGVGDDVGDGRGRQGPKHNKYAKLVDEFEWGWDILHPENTQDIYPCRMELVIEADKVLEKYRPRICHGDENYVSSSSDDDDDDDESDYENTISE